MILPVNAIVFLSHKGIIRQGTLVGLNAYPCTWPQLHPMGVVLLDTGSPSGGFCVVEHPLSDLYASRSQAHEASITKAQLAKLREERAQRAADQALPAQPD